MSDYSDGKYDGKALDRLSERDVQDAVLDHLASVADRRWVAPTDVLQHLLSEHGGGPADAKNANYAGRWLYDTEDGAAKPDALKFQAVMWALIARGIVAPGFQSFRRGGIHNDNIVQRLYLTERGRRLLQAGVGGSPVGPRFLEAFRQGCPNPNGDDDLDDVHARIEDAVSCLDAFIPRAAVVMTGLAFEVTISRSLAAMASTGLVSQSKAKKARNAKDKLEAVRKGAEQWKNHGTAEEKHQLLIAIGVAEAVRGERNRAAHDAASTFDQAGAEELVKCAAHHIPLLWTVVIKP